MKRLLATAVAVAALSGCVRANVTPYRTLPPRPVQAVEVFSERVPEREFDEIGLIEVHGAQDSNYGKLVKRAQQEAAKIGADAIIVSRRPIKGADALVFSGPLKGASVRESEEPRIWVVAVAWKDRQ